MRASTLQRMRRTTGCTSSTAAQLLVFAREGLLQERPHRPHGKGRISLQREQSTKEPGRSSEREHHRRRPGAAVVSHPFVNVFRQPSIRSVADSPDDAPSPLGRLGGAGERGGLSIDQFDAMASAALRLGSRIDQGIRRRDHRTGLPRRARQNQRRTPAISIERRVADLGDHPRRSHRTICGETAGNAREHDGRPRPPAVAGSAPHPRAHGLGAGAATVHGGAQQSGPQESAALVLQRAEQVKLWSVHGRQRTECPGGP